MRARHYEQIKQSQKSQGRPESRAARTVAKDGAGELRSAPPPSGREIAFGRQGGRRSGGGRSRGPMPEHLHGRPQAAAAVGGVSGSGSIKEQRSQLK